MPTHNQSRKLRGAYKLLISLFAVCILPTPLMAQDSVPISAEEMTEAQQAEAALLKRGKKLFKRCDSCHTVGNGEADGIGPNLYGIFGTQAGQRPGFDYSEPMVNSGIIWDDETMSALIRKPKKLIPKTDMVFWGMRKDADREALIHYLRQVTE